MTASQENSDHRKEQTAVSGKKYPVSAGTAVFLIFSFILILGFCRFSFYVLKNHRSAIDRDTLVKTYVDVQPYAGGRKEKSSYIVLRNQDKAVPAPFFISQTSGEGVRKTVSEKRAANEAPSPVLAETPREPAVLSPVAAAVKRPPVIKTASAVPAVSTPEKAEKAENKQPDGVSLDNLMTSGLTLLTESDEAVIASELLLREEIPADDSQPAKEDTDLSKALLPTAEAEPAAAPVKKTESVKKQAAKKNKEPETRWVDIALLRRQLSEAKEKEEIRRKNAALLEMNGARQTAALNTRTATDVLPEQTETVAAATTPKASPSPAPAAKPRDTAAAAEKPAEKNEKAVQTAVVQDIPFAGTAESPQQTASVKQNAFLAGNSPGLWKIAKARGKTQNTPEVKKEETIATKPADAPVESETVLAARQDPEKPAVIYKNGKASAVVQNQSQKSLNWLDRQEAAVWTSMSQSDTPSVWSAAADAETGFTDRAKAFRVADEQPAAADGEANAAPQKAEENVISSLPVRVVGEDQKPEAKVNPLLLPLGTPAKVPADAPVAAPVAAVPVLPAGLPPKVNPDGLAEALSPTAATTEKKKENDGENGLVNKLFSFFGKAEESPLPDIGSGTAPAVRPEKDKKPQKSEKFKTANKQSAAQRQEKQPEKQILPTELRLTFKPDSSEMSAQSVKWIKAFGQRAKKDIQNAVEVRMSDIDPDLQEKRFALIHSTLTGIGMEDVQIIPVMTDRTPHTIVLRMIVLPEEGYTEYTSENGGVKERLYYKKW